MYRTVRFGVAGFVMLASIVAFSLLGGWRAFAAAERTTGPSGTITVRPPGARPSLLPAATPGPAGVSNDLDADIGATVAAITKRFGPPQIVLRSADGQHLAYQIDDGRAWRVYYVTNNVVAQVQIVQTAGKTSTMQMPAGLAFNMPQEQATRVGGQAPITVKDVVVYPGARGTKRFAGFQRGVLTRYGVSTERVDVPAYIRFFQFNGKEYIRPQLLASESEEDALVKRFSCGGTQYWHIASRKPVDAHGVQVVQLRCGQSAEEMPWYFSFSPATQMLPPWGSTHPPTVASAQRFTSSTGPAVWATMYQIPPQDRREYWSSGTELASEFGFDSTLNPLSFHVITFAPNTQYINSCGDVVVTNPYGHEITVTGHGSAVAGKTREAARPPANVIHIHLANSPRADPGGIVRKHQQGLRNAQSLPADLTAVTLANNCSFGSSSYNKCNWTDTSSFGAGDTADCPPQGACLMPGDVTYAIVMHTAGGDYLSPPITSQIVGDARYFEHSEGQCTRAETGIDCSVNVVNGALRHHYSDFTLSGPAGLEFSRTYDSTDAQFAAANLGYGWHHSYSQFIDRSTRCNGRLTYYTESGSRIYFSGLEPGSSAFDDATGDTLHWNSDGTFTLNTWDRKTLKFDVSGRLSSIADRVGNLQTVARNTQGLINTVTDALGRVMTFSYDGLNRINAVAVTSGPRVSFAYDGSGCSQTMCTATEPDGGKWTFAYQNYQNGEYLQQITDPLNHVAEVNTYATSSVAYVGLQTLRVASQKTGAGAESLSFAYALDGGNFAFDQKMKTTVTDGLSRTTTFESSELLQQVTDVVGPLCKCNGLERHWTYDQFGREVSFMDSTGFVRNTGYGDDGIFTLPQPSNGNTSYISTPYLRPTTVVEPNYPGGARTTTIAFAPLAGTSPDLAQTVTTPSAAMSGSTRKEVYTYGPTGLMTAVNVTGYVGTSLLTLGTGYTYDARGRLTQVTGPRTDVVQKTTLAYYPDTDADLGRRGQLMTATDALAHVTRYAAGAAPFNSYDLFGNPKSVTDENGVVTTHTYDGAGRATNSTLKAGSVSLPFAMSYDYLGHEVTEFEPLGNGVQVKYDVNNKLSSISTVDGAGLQHDQNAYGYDPMNQLTTDSNAACTAPAATCAAWTTTTSHTYSYDALGRLAQIAFPSPAGEVTQFSYWPANYTGAGLLESQVTGVASKMSTYTTYPDGDFLEYDQAHHVKTQAHLDLVNSNGYYLTGTNHIQYNAQDNETTVSLDSGLATTRLYDDFGRVTSETSQITGLIKYTYDGAGNMLGLSRADGSAVLYAYDALDRETSETATAPSAPQETKSFTYDDTASGDLGVGRLHTMTDPSGSTTYTYDQRGLVLKKTRIVSGTSFSSTYVYDANGNVTAATRPSGLIVNYTYDYSNRPVTAKSATTNYVTAATYLPFGPAKTLTYGNGAVRTVTFDQNYLPSEIVLKNAAGTVLSDLQYGREDSNRVASITDVLNSGYNQQYTYNNSQLRSGTSNGAIYSGLTVYQNNNYDTYYQQFTGYTHGTGPYHYNYFNAYASYGQQPTSNQTESGTYAIGYDSVGNEKTVKTAQYAYSARELLSSGDGLSYKYDADDWRVAATSGANTRVYVYDDNQKLEAESDTAGRTDAYDYVWFGDMPVAQADAGGQTHWTHVDNIGTPIVQLDTSGNVYWQADYEPFGRVNALRTAAVHQPLRRPGQEAEMVSSNAANGDSARYYNGYRWYRPDWGRYTQPDPAGIEASPYNLYDYALNDPFNLVDEDGLIPNEWMSLIPVVGPAWDAVDSYRCGAYVWGTINVIMAISDVIPVKAVGGAIVKGAWKGGSHTWGATRGWLGRRGYAESRDIMHHWFFERNEGIGKNVPEVVKNQPWNVMNLGKGAANQQRHDALHGKGALAWRNNPAARFWHGTPPWAKSALVYPVRGFNFINTGLSCRPAQRPVTTTVSGGGGWGGGDGGGGFH